MAEPITRPESSLDSMSVMTSVSGSTGRGWSIYAMTAVRDIPTAAAAMAKPDLADTHPSEQPEMHSIDAERHSLGLWTDIGIINKGGSF